MNITTDNIEEWCFRYLEKDLDSTEQKFFESELTSNKALQKEYALWEKTKITDLVIDFPTQLNTPLLRYNMQLLWLCIELSIVVGLSLLSVCFPSTTPIVKDVLPTKTYITIDTIKKDIQQEYVTYSKHEVVKEANVSTSETPLNAPIIQPYIDSTNSVTAFPKSEEPILPTTNPTSIDSIKTPKDSTVKIATPKKIKPTNRKRRTGSSLIPINNDL